MPSSNHHTTLVIVDSNVDDYQSLLGAINSQAQVVILNSDQDGVEQMSSILAAHDGIESLHILSHGAPGQLQLGSTDLTGSGLAHSAQQIQAWAKALSSRAEIFLYGCRVAAGAIGQQFVEQLSQLTGATVAASTTLTGHADLGGDWQLSFTTGPVSTPLAPEVLASYRGVLPVEINETFANDDVSERPWLFGVDASASTPTPQEQPFLTARTITAPSTGGLRGNLPGSTPDPIGSGALRLTSTSNDQAGFVLYNSAIAATSGLTVKFDFFSYGGTGADGLTFFLIDGTAAPTSGGAFGGSIGYAQRTVPTPVAGIAGGYLGIAFDEFGNFSNPTEGRVGGVGFVPDSIAVRGSAATGYAYLTGTGTLPFSIDNPGATATRDASRRSAQIDLTAAGLLTVQIDGNGDGDFTDAGEQAITNFNVAAANGGVPASFKFGFAGGTGGQTNIHEIRNLVIRTPVGDPNLPPNAANARVVVPPSSTVNLTGLSATDSDGAISTYTILTLPAVADGVLFLGNPATGGSAVTAGQVLAPSQISQLFFQATASFDGGSFTYTATDNERATDATPATVSLALTGDNLPPSTQGDTVNVRRNQIVAVPGLTATDSDGTIASFTVSTLPPAADGILFVGNPAAGGTRVRSGQRLTPAQSQQLFFQASSTFNSSSFTFTATDNLGDVDPTPARITLRRVTVTEAPDDDDDDAGCEPGVTRKGNPSRNQINGTVNTDRLIGFAGNDRLNGFGCRDRIDGGLGNDSLVGGNGRDILKGQQGNDRLQGDKGRDTLSGGLGGDRIFGGLGNDSIGAGRGRDRVFGGNGSDRATGGQGNDRMEGGIGSDILEGNTGRDTLMGGQGADSLKGGLSNDRLNGGAKADVLNGGRGDDNLNGAAGSDRLLGGRGSDKLYGGTQGDILNGGAGRDILVGGRRADVLTGGAGRDQFVCRSIGDRGDRITDFQVGRDQIVVKGIFDNPAYGKSDRFKNYIRFAQSGSNTIVRIDGNGDVGGGFVNLVTVLGVNATALGANSFVVV